MSDRYEALYCEGCRTAHRLNTPCLPAPAGLPTPEEIDAVSTQRIVDMVRAAEAEEGGSNAANLNALIAGLKRAARLAVEAQQERPSDGGQRGPDTSPEVPALRKHTSDCDLAPYLLGLMDVRCTCGVLDHMPIRREQLREANRAGFSAERQESHPPRPTGGTE